MRISGFDGPKGPKRADKKKPTKAGKASSSSMQSITRDEVEVTDHRETLDMIRDLVGDTPDIRVDVVERIMGELKRGKYKINFEKVAEGFIKDAILNEIAQKKINLGKKLP